MRESKTRLLVLGVDAASPDLLDAWIADGTLPHLRALVERGATGRLGGIDGFYVGSTWPSIYTGTGPARHGFHYQLQIIPGTYELHWRPDGEFVRTEPLWSVLERAGLNVAALDVPLSRPSPGPRERGVQVVEWGGHDSLYGFSAFPPDVEEDLRDRFGVHPLGPSCDAVRETAADYSRFLEQLEEGIRLKTQWTRDLLDRGDWDMFMQVFTAGHCAGHQCWHLHDRDHPAFDEGIVSEIGGDPLRRIYQALDAAVGELVAAAGDTQVVVFSGHGMSYWHGAQFLLPEILQGLGVTAPLPGQHRQPLARRLAAQVWRRLPSVAKEPLRRARARLAAPLTPGPQRPPTIKADLARSRCFPLNNGQAVGGIRLNLAGREPGGLLEPGTDADEFCDQLAADLLAIVDERTGRPLVRDVRRTDALHGGDRLDTLPDLLVDWNDLVPTGSTLLAGGAGATVRASSPKLGVVEGVNEYGRTGEHRPGGWFVSAGPGISPTRVAFEVPLTALAPSLAAMVGVDMPSADHAPAPELSGEGIHIALV